MKILIVEDDPEIASMVREGLDDAGYFTTVCRDGERALRLALAGSYSFILLDLMLPSMDGLTVCRRLREARLSVPILIFTAKDKISERVAGLEAGADDYLVKPFDFEELLARVRALLRRETVLKQSLIVIDNLSIDTLGKRVQRAGKDITLTAREYVLLEAMARRFGQVFTRDAIQERLWLDGGTASNVVDVTIKNLRKKIDGDSQKKLIHTIYGLGYVMRLDGES